MWLCNLFRADTNCYAADASPGGPKKKGRKGLTSAELLEDVLKEFPLAGAHSLYVGDKCEAKLRQIRTKASSAERDAEKFVEGSPEKKQALHIQKHQDVVQQLMKLYFNYRQKENNASGITYSAGLESVLKFMCSGGITVSADIIPACMHRAKFEVFANWEFAQTSSTKLQNMCTPPLMQDLRIETAEAVEAQKKYIRLGVIGLLDDGSATTADNAAALRGAMRCLQSFVSPDSQFEFDQQLRIVAEDFLVLGDPASREHTLERLGEALDFLENAGVG